jgi:4-alpha-glucanotransferase
MAKAWPEFQGVSPTKEFTPEVHRAMLAAALNSQSNLCVLPWQDILGTRDRINLPGTMSDSNWAYRITQNVDRLLEEEQTRTAAEKVAWLTASARR